MRTASHRHGSTVGRIGFALIVAGLTAAACGDRPAPAGSPVTPLMTCLDACTETCQDDEVFLQECGIDCAFTCLCQDQCRQTCQDESGVLDEACNETCAADCLLQGT